MFKAGKDIKHLSTTDDYGYVMLEDGTKFAIKILTAEEVSKHYKQLRKELIEEYNSKLKHQPK